MDGLLANEVWDVSKIISKEELMKSGGKFNLGRLMTILSMKHAESPELRKLKARIVFRGDQIVDQDNNIAILQELKVNPSGITAINFNLSYGALPGNEVHSRTLCVHTLKVSCEQWWTLGCYSHQS